MAVEPKVLVWDVPDDRLGIGEIRGVLRQIEHQQSARGLAVLLLSRQPDVVRGIRGRILVLYMGRVMEQADCEELFGQPRHPCTRELLKPVADGQSGLEPNPADPPSGCVYRARCIMADSLCAREVPHLRRAGASHAACHFVSAPA